MYNNATLVGRLGRDPEVRYTSSGNAVCNFSVATSYKSNGKDDTFWGNITAWGKTAEACAKYLKKGSLVLVSGRLKEERWEDKGAKKSKVVIVANEVKFLDTKGSADTGSETTGEESGEQEPF